MRGARLRRLIAALDRSLRIELKDAFHRSNPVRKSAALLIGLETFIPGDII
jgi:hypothetical protein